MEWLSELRFKGHENSILLTSEYYQKFSCEFDLVYYPFDTQVNIVGNMYAALLFLFINMFEANLRCKHIYNEHLETS